MKNKSALLVATHEKNLIHWCDNKINLEQFVPQKTEKKHLVKELI